MRSMRQGLIVAIAFTALLLSALWLLVQAAPNEHAARVGEEVGRSELPVETGATQAVGLLVTATVGTASNQCATARRVQVNANTPVYYCFRIHHTGVQGDEAFITHTIQTSRGGIDEDVVFRLEPGQPEDTIGQTAFPRFPSDSASTDVTNIVTWTARTQSGVQVIVTSTASIDVVGPAVDVVKTVGQDPNTCPVARTLNIPTGQRATFCISIQNTGDVTLTSHTLNDTISNQTLLDNVTFSFTLPPGETLRVLPSNLEQLDIDGTLHRNNVTGLLVNNVSYTGRTANGLSASGTSTATVDVGNTTVSFTKTVSTDPLACNGTATIQVNPGTNVFYCAIIVNTGVVTLTQHRLTEGHLSIDVTFDYVLPPGATLRVTNGFLGDNHLPIVFGPFEIHPRFGAVINNPMSYTGTAPGGFAASASAGTSATYIPAPTATRTSRPDPTSTFTPGPTNTPTPTFTPTPVTPSPTPTDTPVTPSPTPTRSYAISLLETPTPRTQAAGIPGAVSPDPSQNPGQPTVDPNFPQPDFPQPGSPLPGQDPVLATATQIAVDATSTAVIAEATAAQLAIESAAATALAEAQAPLPDSTGPDSPLPFPDSPLATPTIDPAIGQGDAAGFPGVGGVPVGAVPTLPGVAPADITVLPPVVTAVIATETPPVMVLVVTNTPEPGSVLPEGQRPIVPPTPTPTADFVMAAARTFDVAVTTFGWLWFLVGSLVFFVTAGIVAGLFFRQSEVNRYELPEPDYWVEEVAQPDSMGAAPPRARRNPTTTDEEWPANLP